jgi:hypothetical protein
MDYRVICGCGKSLAVSAGSAGMRLPCPCGRTVEVPSLRELRRLHGEVVTVNPVIAIEQLGAAGGLPTVGPCVRCGRDDAATVHITAECERRWIRRPSRWKWVFLALWHWPLALILHLWERQTESVDAFGRDIVLDLPVRLCPTCGTEARTPAAIADVLREVPVYARLLDRYPEAKLTLKAGNPA